MAKEIVWENLTPEEAQTIADLEDRGEEIFAAPIEIEEDVELRQMQFASLGISWSQCRTWYIGSEKVLVHLTPADEPTYKFLLGELRARHRVEYRRKRCLIPGELKPLIVCPECNRCSECPFPEYRDQHHANELSWEELIGSGYEGTEHSDDPDTRLTLEEACRIIDAKNPRYTKAIVLKEYLGLSVAEIARELDTTERNIRFFIDEAKKIGRQYNS